MDDYTGDNPDQMGDDAIQVDGKIDDYEIFNPEPLKIKSAFVNSKKDGLQSVYPCTEYLTFGPWLYLVPQFRPIDVLILGYAGGSVAGLIQLFYGHVPITGVDIKPVENLYNVDFVNIDARDYIKTCRHFDVIVVDLFVDTMPCDFVFDQEFAKDVTAKCEYLIIHAHEGSDMSAYGKHHKVKTIALNSSRFHYFAIGACPRLPVR